MHICDTKKEENKNHFCLEFLIYTHTKSQSQNICNNNDLPKLLAHKVYQHLGKHFSNPYKCKNKTPKQTN